MLVLPILSSAARICLGAAERALRLDSQKAFKALT
jgi:hypothetical protein